MIIRTAGVRPQIIAGMLAGATGYVLATLVAAEILSFKFLLLLVPVMLIIMVTELYRKQDRPFDSLAHTFFPLIYSALPFSMFPFSAYSHEGLNSLLPHGQIQFSPAIVIGFFLLLWANDTGAYLAGISFGRHRLMERISPKKSWEGFFGGLVIAASSCMVAFRIGWE